MLVWAGRERAPLQPSPTLPYKNALVVPERSWGRDLPPGTLVRCGVVERRRGVVPGVRG
jgi:hypothetical protein